jgi:enoyl-CoA hydratase/carnithine racemase
MVNLEIHEQVATLQLCRPEVRNAISVVGWAEIARSVEQAVAAGARLLVLRGETGGAFSAGADLRDFGRFAENADARAEFRRAMRIGIDGVANAPIATIAVIEGACFGAGTALAMACDIRFADADAQFAITPAKFGIGYPQEDVHRLVSLVGPGQAARLLISAKSIDGREAERIGLVERCFDTGLEEALSIMALAITANDGDSVRMLKQGIRLAVAGVRHDEEQDRSFDAMLGSEVLARRLPARSGGGR